ncbi:MAG TPA: SMI1/KNR4 family protein [Chthonomonadaceae bacterium]|nr:SMI1/KNR4 family protein [Chthonomonadaceae bacterium]
MSLGEDRSRGGVAEGLRAVERFWQVRLPESFRNLYTHFAKPFLAPCEFFPLEAIAGGVGRSFGMLPQYLPFGRAVDESGLYGFYLTPETALGRWPVLFWDEDEMYHRPVTSDFEAFLRHCVLVGRYEMEEQWPDNIFDWQEESDVREFARLLNLPEALLLSPIPRNDTELYERLACSDAQDAFSLCHLGCIHRARGDSERALDFFHRASEAAPWFGDPPYLVADVYRERQNVERAVQSWWAVVQRLLPLCTRTWEWDLGEDHPEADIYEVAADGLAQYSEVVDAAIKNQSLWHVVVHQDPYDPEARETLGNALLAANDLAGAEREYLNALSLCCSDRDRRPDRLYDSLLRLYERMDSRRDGALARFDSMLPRPTV